MMPWTRLAALALPVLVLAACSNTETPAPAPSSAPPPAPSAEAQPVAAAGEADLAPLFGTWALDPARCEGPVLKISQTRFEGAENGCDIAGFTDNGNGSYTAHLRCSAEGNTVEEAISMRPIFAPTGEGIDLTYLNRENLTTTVLRCPGA